MKLKFKSNGTTQSEEVCCCEQMIFEFGFEQRKSVIATSSRVGEQNGRNLSSANVAYS